MKKRKTDQLGTQGRRGFLRQAGQTGLLAGAAVLGASGAQREVEPAADSASAEDKRGYHETEHIRQYYRTSGLF